MHGKSAAIALLITAVLAAATLFVLRKPATGPTGRTRLLAVNPGNSPTLRIDAGAESYTLAPGPLPGVWLLRNPAGVDWPIAPMRFRAALRLLAEAELEESQPAPAGPEDAALTLTITNRPEDEPVRIVFGRLATGGRAPAHVGGPGPWRRGMCDARLRELFEPRSLAQWLEGAAAPYRDSPIQSIRLARGETELELSAAGSAWSLRRPVLWPADAAACEQLRRAISGAAARIVPTSGAPDADEAPSLVVELTSERREEIAGQVRRTMIVQSIRLGAPADLSGRTIFATLEARALSPDGAALWGPVTAVLSQEDFAGLSLRPDAYAARVAWDGAAPEIRAVSISAPDETRRVRFALDVLGWGREGEPGQPPREEREAVAALLRLLCDERADAVSFARAQATALARVRFGPAQAPEAQMVELLLGGDGVLIVRTSATDLFYSGSMTAQRLGAWIAALLAGG